LGRIVARQTLVVAGTEIAGAVFARIDPSLKVERVRADGELVGKGTTVMTVAGLTRSILSGERTALNFLQRLSGIASQTREFVLRATGPGGNPAARVFDTRKTTPGWRLLEKAAVRVGGGCNHRFGLDDAAMVKDNHLVAEHRVSALKAGILALRERFPQAAFVEVEADRLDQVREFLGLEGIDTILLDNMSVDEMREAVTLRDALAPRVQLEASGGVTLDSITAIAATGVDAISVGALTHSARAADLALDLESVES
jgi:nicotinate-nucleotide pyrophosphorylase (carboxylating)